MKTIAVILSLSIAALAEVPKSIKQYLLFIGDPIYAVTEEGGKIIVIPDAGKPVENLGGHSLKYRLVFNNLAFDFSESDEFRSAKWMEKNDQKGRLLIKNGDLYLDGKLIDLDGAEVTSIYEAVTWRKGILCHARTYRKKSKDRVKTLANLFTPSSEDIEPYCVIWINTQTHKGVSRWIYGKVRRKMIVFPLP